MSLLCRGRLGAEKTEAPFSVPFFTEVGRQNVKELAFYRADTGAPCTQFTHGDLPPTFPKTSLSVRYLQNFTVDASHYSC